MPRQINKTAVLFKTIGCVCLALIPPSIIFARQQRTWQQIPAKVLPSEEPITSSNITYEYVVGEYKVRTKQKRGYLLDKYTTFLNAKKDYQAGQIVKILVNPSNPSTSVIDPLPYLTVPPPIPIKVQRNEITSNPE
eukprot:TRINITY_DN10895_c0_g1_i1.p1 TRINITY_DN10895_c0_g1~~TRINITY_DN10895_c0_g1_i1.p1  ORF type:complete len:136 (+),score=28.53 TRINITY_DN10895_c0_g1_i1:198-605(+)